MAVVGIWATARRRSPRPGEWFPAQIDYRLITAITPRDTRPIDQFAVKLTGGWSIGTWRVPDSYTTSATPAGPPTSV